MPGYGSGAVVLPWSSPRGQHHAAVTRKVHLTNLFSFPEPPQGSQVRSLSRPPSFPRGGVALDGIPTIFFETMTFRGSCLWESFIPPLFDCGAAPNTGLVAPTAGAGCKSLPPNLSTTQPRNTQQQQPIATGHSAVFS
jgi:hypothetical protein